MAKVDRRFGGTVGKNPLRAAAFRPSDDKAGDVDVTGAVGELLKLRFMGAGV